MKCRSKSRQCLLTFLLLSLAASTALARHSPQLSSEFRTTGRSLRRLLQDQLPQEEQLVVSEQELQHEVDQEDVVDFPLGTFGDDPLVADSASTEAGQLEETQPFDSDANAGIASQADQLVVVNPDRAEADPNALPESNRSQLPSLTSGETTSEGGTASSDPFSASEQKEEAELGESDITLSDVLNDSTDSPQNSSRSSTTAESTNDEALARGQSNSSSTQNVSSTGSTSALSQVPILESELPSFDGLNSTLTSIANASIHSINGSLQAAISEPDSASNVTAGNTGNTTGLLGTGANSESTNVTGSILEQAAMLNASSVNSTLNATQSLLFNSVSAGSALLSNSTLLGSPANQSANTTHLAAQSAASGGLESNTLLDGQAANATAATAILPQNRTVASAAGSVVEGSKSAAAGLLSGARSFFNQNSSRDGSNRTAASGLLTGLNTTALNGTSSISSLAGSGQLTDGQEVNMDADLELAYTGQTGSGMHHSFNAGNASSNTTTTRHASLTAHPFNTSSSTAAGNTSTSHSSTAGLSHTSGLSVLANATNTTRAGGLSGAANATNATAGFGLGSQILPGSGTRNQRTADSFGALGAGEELTPAQIAQLDDEEYQEYLEAGSNRASVTGAGAASQHGGSAAGHGSSQSVHSTVLGGGSTAAHNSSVRPGAGTAANPGLLDKQRAESGIVRIPADESDYGIGQARTSSQTGTQSGASTTSNLYTGGLENEYEDTNFGEDSFGLPGTGSNSQRASSGVNSSGASHSGSAAGAGTGAGAASHTGTGGVASGSSDASTAANRREQERNAAYQASTGGLPQGSNGSKSTLGGAASQSWGELASRASNALKGNTGSRQHMPSLASSHTSDQSSSGIASSSSASSLGHPTGQHSQSGSQGVGGGQALGVGTVGQAQKADFLSQRDPTNPSSVVGAHSAWVAEPHTALSQGHTGTDGVTAGNAKVSLAADADVSARSGSVQPHVVNHLQTEADSTDGPLVVGGTEEDALLPHSASSRQSSRNGSRARSLLNIIIDNWVVLSAFVALVGTGTVLGFVFVRGIVPNPLDAVSFGNVGTSGYAGNTKYSSVERDDEGSGWDQSWGEDDLPKSSSASHSTSNSGSPVRPTGMGKLKKGTFAKKKAEKKPDNWSNDF